MRRSLVSLFTLVAVFGFGVALAGKKNAARAEPEHVVVQHCLIGFKKSVPNKKLDRTKGEAADLAEEILGRARDGEDFDALVEEYTDDSHPGILRVANDGVPRQDAREYPRSDLAAWFGDAAFEIEVGQYALVKYNPVNSPFGWHVVKRLE